MQNIAIRSPEDAHIDQLVEAYQLVRILEPSVRRQIEQVVQKNPDQQAYLQYHQGNLYLSLNSINNPKRRSHIYHQIQQYQIDPTTSLEQLPDELYLCFYAHPPRLPVGRAILVGAGIGILCGLIGMALGIMLTAMLGTSDNYGGFAMTAVIFVLGCTLGWAGATLYFWRHSQSGNR
jgi:hypothetical protein